MSRIWKPSGVSACCCAVLSCAMLLAPTAGLAQYGATNGEWRSYGGDLGSTKYSPLDQIDAGNFGDLSIAWRWQTVDALLDLEQLREEIPQLSIGGLQATPLMVGATSAIHPPAGTLQTFCILIPTWRLIPKAALIWSNRGAR